MNKKETNDIPQICINCVYGKKATEDTVVCSKKKEVMRCDESCKKYKFDIFKYVPNERF